MFGEKITDMTYLADAKTITDDNIIENDLFDIKRRVNIKKLKKQLNLNIDGRKIKYILAMEADSISTMREGFENKANKDITFKEPLFCLQDTDGAYQYGSFYVYDHPVGIICIVMNA
jgi:hypothetical protein